MRVTYTLTCLEAVGVHSRNDHGEYKLIPLINEKNSVKSIQTIYFENLCVARCRHDYGLRTSLAKEIKEQTSIVTVFTRRFGPI